MPDAASPDFSAITGRMQQTWATGDFNRIATVIASAAEDLVDAAQVRAGHRVLDVACGSGNAALAAARRHADVTGLDYVPTLVERARQRAEADQTPAEFHVGDAQALPYETASFDRVLSVFGVMFAPDHERAAAELLRVCKPGGTIALANWMPEDFGGDIFRTMAKHVPPPPGVKPGVRWGTAQGLGELLGHGGRVTHERRTVTQYFRSVDHMLDQFLTYFGPAVKAKEVVGEAGYPALRQDLGEVFARYNRATDGTAAVECAYMQAIVTRH